MGHTDFSDHQEQGTKSNGCKLEGGGEMHRGWQGILWLLFHKFQLESPYGRLKFPPGLLLLITFRLAFHKSLQNFPSSNSKADSP